MKKVRLTEEYFGDKSLAKCLREAADWIDKHTTDEKIRGLHVEQDSEYPDWYISLFLYEDFNETK